MPNRILRDWTDSETVDKLSVYAERFFTRLIMKVDDYGRFTANTRVLNGNLFILKDDVRDTDITRWLDECQAAGLLLIYEVENKKYLQIENFKQTLRIKKEKHPSPICIADDKQMISIRAPEKKRNEVEKKGSEEHHQFDLSESNIYRKPVIPELSEVEEFFIQSGGTKEMAKKFFESNQITGWYYQNNPIINFRPRAGFYIETWKRNETKDKSKKTETYQEKLNKAI